MGYGLWVSEAQEEKNHNHSLNKELETCFRLFVFSFYPELQLRFARGVMRLSPPVP
jgi:hypothetical protein